METGCIQVGHVPLSRRAVSWGAFVLACYCYYYYYYYYITITITITTQYIKITYLFNLARILTNSQDSD